MFNDVQIEGLRGVGRVELRLRENQRVYTLFGANGVGKTKCLEALYLSILLSNKTLAGQQMHFDGENFPLSSLTSDGRRFDFSQQHNSIDTLLKLFPSEALHELPVVFLGARNRSALAGSGRANAQLLGTFDQRRARHCAQIVDLVQSGRLAESGMATDVPSWFVQRAQSANPYQKESDNRQNEIDTVLSMLHAVDERIHPNFLQIDGGGRVFFKIDSQLRALDELSSGFTSLVKLIQAIVSGYASFTNEARLSNVRGWVLIDEIESHLHAQWQATIIPRLKSLLPNTTFYVATHSPLVLAQLQEGEAYLLQRDKSDGVVRSSVIDSPDRRAFADVLESAFGIDLNLLKRESLERDDQKNAKRALLRLLDDRGSAP